MLFLKQLLGHVHVSWRGNFSGTFSELSVCFCEACPVAGGRGLSISSRGKITVTSDENDVDDEDLEEGSDDASSEDEE